MEWCAGAGAGAGAGGAGAGAGGACERCAPGPVGCGGLSASGVGPHLSGHCRGSRGLALQFSTALGLIPRDPHTGGPGGTREKDREKERER